MGSAKGPVANAGLSLPGQGGVGWWWWWLVVTNQDQDTARLQLTRQTKV
jgi:hypothetical protein